NPVGAWQLCDGSYTLEDIKARMPLGKIDLSPLYQKPPKRQGKHTLEEAKELYPGWYQSKIVEGKPLKKTWT
ncbi:repa, partial [Clostridioides difficile]